MASIDMNQSALLQKVQLFLLPVSLKADVGCIPAHALPLLSPPAILNHYFQQHVEP